MGDLLPIDPVENAIPAIGATAYGTRIRITVTDNDVVGAIDAGFRRIVVERSANAGLTWADITVHSERPVLEADKKEYTFYDRRGDPGFRYRVRYITESGELGQPSEDIAGVGLATQNILTVPQLKERYFFGIDLTDEKGRPFPDGAWQFFILAAIRWFEKRLDIPILPTTIISEFQDYDANSYAAYNFIKLDNAPVISVEEFRVQYPSGQSVVRFPGEWLRLNRLEGQLQIVPSAGTLSEILIGQGGSFLPAIYGGLAYLPQLFSIDYTAGFEEGQVPADIIDLIGMMASIGPFNVFGDLITGAGIGNLSLSMDGLSQSISTTQSAMYGGYGNRTSQYEKQIKTQIPNLRRYYKGIPMVVG